MWRSAGVGSAILVLSSTRGLDVARLNTQRGFGRPAVARQQELTHRVHRGFTNQSLEFRATESGRAFGEVLEVDVRGERAALNADLTAAVLRTVTSAGMG